MFCSQERGLWRGNRKGAKTLFLCVPVVSLEEMLSMKRSLPQFQVWLAILFFRLRPALSLQGLG